MIEPLRRRHRFVGVVVDRLQQLVAVHHGPDAALGGRAGDDRFRGRDRRGLSLAERRDLFGRGQGRLRGIGCWRNGIGIADVEMGGDAAGQRAELHGFQKGDELARFGFGRFHLFKPAGKLRVSVERHEL